MSFFPFQIQRSTPTAGQTVSCNSTDSNLFLHLTPAGTLATLTVNLPADSVSRIGQEVRVLSTQTITALTVANAATIINGATTLAANGIVSFHKIGVDTWITEPTGDVTLTGAQTLTNKTLTAPIISTISNTGVLTLPTATTTLVGHNTTDTLTNKTFDTADNTLLLHGEEVTGNSGSGGVIAFTGGPTFISPVLGDALGTSLSLVGGGIILNTLGQGIKIKEGANAKMGTATLVAGTVTVSTTAVLSATSRIILTRQSAGASTAIGSLAVGTVVDATSFVIDSLKSDATVETNDISVVHWLIVDLI